MFVAWLGLHTSIHMLEVHKIKNYVSCFVYVFAYFCSLLSRWKFVLQNVLSRRWLQHLVPKLFNLFIKLPIPDYHSLCLHQFLTTLLRKSLYCQNVNRITTYGFGSHLPSRNTIIYKEGGFFGWFGYVNNNAIPKLTWPFP